MFVLFIYYLFIYFHSMELNLSVIDEYARHLQKENIKGLFGKFEFI